MARPWRKPKPDVDPFVKLRQRMVREQLRRRDISDSRVLSAMSTVPRHDFVPEHLVRRAYDDGPLPIGHGQTISQPYIVALMTQLAQPTPSCRALDVGTGSGYQAAVLASLVKEVVSIEIVPALGEVAARKLNRPGCENVSVQIGDAVDVADEGSFDVIIAAAAAPRVPEALCGLLSPGGRMVLPVGEYRQELVVIQRVGSGFAEQQVGAVAFVPMTGRVRQEPAKSE